MVQAAKSNICKVLRPTYEWKFYTRGWQTTACGPAACFCKYIFWNTARFILLSVIYEYFLTTVAELNSCDRKL